MFSFKFTNLCLIIIICYTPRYVIGDNIIGVATPNIVGGAPAENGQFPYQISLRYYGEHNCGGSILNKYFVLTAAHCVYQFPVNSLGVVVGTNKLSVGGIVYAVLRTIHHEMYNPDTIVNDVGLVRTCSPIQFNRFIQPIPLNDFQPLPGSMLTLSGWGLTSYPGTIPDELQFIHLQSITTAQCASLNVDPSAPITPNQICTLSPVDEGVCKGDSGGALVDQMGKQVGIVSWGIPCAQGIPDVFTSVASYLQWILHRI